MWLVTLVVSHGILVLFAKNVGDIFHTDNEISTGVVSSYIFQCSSTF